MADELDLTSEASRPDAGSVAATPNGSVLNLARDEPATNRGADPTLQVIQDREDVRGYLARSLLKLVVVVSIGSMLGLTVDWITTAQLKDLLTGIFAPLLGVFGTVTGFYYGNAAANQQSPPAPTQPQPPQPQPPQPPQAEPPEPQPPQPEPEPPQPEPPDPEPPDPPEPPQPAPEPEPPQPPEPPEPPDPHAPEPHEPEPAGDVSHTVRPGENLWEIAETRLRDVRGSEPEASDLRAYWGLVIQANAGGLRSGNPNLIYPEEIIVLPDVPPRQD